MIKNITNENIVRLKSKFFLTRSIAYFSFLLIPVLIQKDQELNRFAQTIITILYCSFMFGQWYLMGKEIDHRFKIYFKANSSIDRIAYRLVIGGAFFIILFNLINIFPMSYIGYIFWGLWVVIGTYYSWPTRGKIIEESMVGQLAEYKYLDALEKTVLFIFSVLFLITIPELPRFENIEAMKLVFDPSEEIHPFLWTFLKVNFYPFLQNPKLFSLAWSLFFYLWGGSLYFLVLYSLLRFLFSRRISMLGLFGLVSSWSVSKIVNNDFASILTSTLPFIWIWAHIWSWRSSTYRSGLLLGITTFLMTLIKSSFIVLYPFSICLTYFISLSGKTPWYRNQIIKYTILGFALSIISLLFSKKFSLQFDVSFFSEWVRTLLVYLDQKAFFVLSIFGLVTTFFLFNKSQLRYVKTFKIDISILKEVSLFLLLMVFVSPILGADLSLEFSMLWWLTLFSLIPVEMIFQSISRLRSKRNLIYFIYVLVCLLDSHFEGRVKIIINFFS